MRPLPSPEEFVRMPWHAKAKLRARLSTEPPEAVPLPPQMTADLNTIIGVLDAMLTEHYNQTHRRSPR